MGKHCSKGWYTSVDKIWVFPPTLRRQNCHDLNYPLLDQGQCVLYNGKTSPSAFNWHSVVTFRFFRRQLSGFNSAPTYPVARRLLHKKYHHIKTMWERQYQLLNAKQVISIALWPPRKVSLIHSYYVQTSQDFHDSFKLNPTN